MAGQYINFEQEGAVLVGRVVPSKVTEREAAVIGEEVEAAAAGSGYRVVLDLSDVMLLASAGLGALLTINKSCKAGGGGLAIYGLSDEILGMFKLTKLDKVLKIKADRGAAVKVVS